jgi:RHH-type transcriptional regulator, rel operon repressor / antitoxin RelB
MLAVRLPQSIEKRLEKLARRTGRTKTCYVREAILEHLDDLEDIYLAERALDHIRSGAQQTTLKFLHQRLAPLDNPRSIGQALLGSKL